MTESVGFRNLVRLVERGCDQCPIVLGASVQDVGCPLVELGCPLDSLPELFLRA